MSITLLGAGHHLHAARRIDGYSSCVHRAELRAPDGGTLTAYVKAFPSSKESKALANEIAGYLLARACGLSTAPRAFILLIHVRKLRKLFPEYTWPGGDDDLFPTWATEELQDSKLTLVSEADAIAWRQRVQQWTQLPAAIAFHQWLQNIDANAGNLLWLGESDFALIDYADILGGQDWTADSLKTAGYLHNKLLHLAYGGVPDPASANAIEESHQFASQAWAQEKGTIIDWWDDLLKRKEAAAAAEFIESRSSADWIKGKVA
ncbi:hypothetical protein [Chromobacterium subtsugae]|uniref:hypothetical protein n=1 Tax=Chromobacterium subtsugae TaxID=251747 RepID=UPI000641425C|nr:hypothetical protein [Chromobacterium subtsugae]